MEGVQDLFYAFFNGTLVEEAIEEKKVKVKSKLQRKHKEVTPRKDEKTISSINNGEIITNQKTMVSMELSRKRQSSIAS